MDNMNNSGAIASTNQHIPCFKKNTEAALFWHQFGFNVIPIVPLLKQPAVKWDPWLDNLDAKKIAAHWAKNPNHELGFIVSDSYLVLDADSPASVAALRALEKESGMPPLLVTATKRGEHHFFRRAKETFAKTDSHSTEQYPDRIDVKTGRSIVVLAPSTGKMIDRCWVPSAAELFEVDQDFIDRVFQHNGREAPRPPSIKTAPSVAREIDSQTYKQLSALLEQLNPEEGGHDGWMRVGMALHTETDGDDDGLDLFDQWSSQGATYPGRSAIESQWRSFNSNRKDRCNIGTIINRVKAAGRDWTAVCSDADAPFEPCEYEVVGLATLPTDDQTTTVGQTTLKTTVVYQAVRNALDRYTLNDQLEQIEAMAVEKKPILGKFAFYGEATAIYALPNVGKTAISMAEIINGINAGIINPADLYYINNDDTAASLAQKVRIANEYGFKMIAETFQEFQASDFLNILDELVEKGQARGKIIILDTLTKFVDVMNSVQARNFTKHIRRFVMHGGTLIALGHANKLLGPDGKPIFRGTTDIINDFDCVYVLSQLKEESGEKIVEFVNKKRRGNVAQSVAYSYSTESGISYHELLASVKEVDATKIDDFQKADTLRSDAELIAVVQSCITRGVNTKMLLADESAKLAGVSKRAAMKIIEKYTGENPAGHRWQFTLGARGAKVYALLDATLPSALELCTPA